LKTAVFNQVAELSKKSDPLNKNDIAASFQQAVFDVLIDKTIKAALSNNVFTIAVAGGVAANNTLRKQFKKQTKKHNFNVYFPDKSLCTDNGAMVAALGFHKYLNGELSDYSLDAEASSPLGVNGLLYK
jgi:N6-L-threonylcarbamoyladenine synthase